MTARHPEGDSSKASCQPFWKFLEGVGHQIFYLTLRLGGQLGAYLLLGPVVFCYVLCSPKIHRQTSFYRQKRFPHQGIGKHWLTTFKIVHNFGKVLVDRAWLGMTPKANLNGEIKGMEKLSEYFKQKKGVVLLTAHVGNWQAAFNNITDLPLPVNSLMHYDDGAVAKHFFELQGKACPFNIINIDSFMGGMVEAAVALQQGEIVTIMGDRYTGGASTKIDFLGSKATLPISAYALAAKTGACVAIMLAAKTGRKSYSLEIKEVLTPDYKNRQTREEQLKKAAQIFVNCLESYLKENPYQWYNFYDFWADGFKGLPSNFSK